MQPLGLAVAAELHADGQYATCLRGWRFATQHEVHAGLLYRDRRLVGCGGQSEPTEIVAALILCEAEFQVRTGREFKWVGQFEYGFVTETLLGIDAPSGLEVAVGGGAHRPSTNSSSD